MKLQLSDYPFTTTFPVHWGEMDAANHVNNLIYLRWAESGRIAFFEKTGVTVDFQKGIGPILGWQDCKYIFPMTFPDKAIVGVRIVEIAEDRFVMECAVFSERHKRIAAVSKQTIIPYNYAKLQKAPMPEAWVEGLNSLAAEAQ